MMNRKRKSKKRKTLSRRVYKEIDSLYTTDGRRIICSMGNPIFIRSSMDKVVMVEVKE